MALNTEMVDLEWYLPWWIYDACSFIEWYKYYCGWYFHPDNSSKASLIQTKHTDAGPDKAVEVVHNPTTTSLELNSTDV